MVDHDSREGYVLKIDLTSILSSAPKVPDCAFWRRAWPLREMGFYVFPIAPKAKHPQVEGGQYRATRDVDQLIRWSKQFPDSNVGVYARDSNLLVIDVDGRSGGRESYAKLKNDFELPPTMRVNTADGFHLYYQFKSDRESKYPSKIKAYPGIDFQLNRYVVGPGSIHPSGVEYKIDRPVEVSPLPQKLVEYYSNYKTSTESVADYDGGVKVDLRTQERVYAQLKAKGPSIKGRGGDQHLFSCAAFLVRDWNLEAEQALSLLRRWRDEFVENTWTDDKLVQKLINAASYGTGELGGLKQASDISSKYIRQEIEERFPETTQSDDLLELVKKALKAVQSPHGKPEEQKLEPLFKCGLELLDKEFDAPNWLVRGLVSNDSVGVIAGEPKANKTWQALEIAISIAAGEPAFGAFQTLPGGAPVAYFAAEDGERSMQKRIRAIVAGKQRPARDIVKNFYYSSRQPVNLSDDFDLAHLIASIWSMPVAPKLVVLDPLRDLHDGDEDKSDSMREVMRRLRLIRDLCDTTVAFIHHSAKAGGDTKKRRAGQKMRGSSAIHGAVDFGVYIGAPDGEKNEWLTVVQTEVKASESAGTYNMSLRVQDDDKGEAIQAHWEKSEYTPDNYSTTKTKSANDNFETVKQEYQKALYKAEEPITHVSVGALVPSKYRNFASLSKARDELLKENKIKIQGGKIALVDAVRDKLRSEQNARGSP